MKRVSFGVAMAIKMAGYPQYFEGQEAHGYFMNGNNTQIYNHDENDCPAYHRLLCVAPTYLEVWLWLWKRGVKIELGNDYDNDSIIPFYGANFIDGIYENPEEAIIAAIEFLADNDLIR